MLSSTKPSQAFKTFKFLPDSHYILPFCFLILTGFTALNFLLLFFLSFRVNQLAQRKTTFVQMINGQAVAIAEQEQLYRHPEVIKNTVRQWATLTFDWDGKVLGTQDLDRGYEIGGNKKVTTGAYFAAFLLQPGAQGFRGAFLKNLAEITPSEVFTGKLRSKLIISYISQPRQIRQGEWEVDFVSTRILMYLGKGKDEEIDFNRTVVLRATDIPDPPQGAASPLDYRVYELRLAGLEIVKMSEFSPQN